MLARKPLGEKSVAANVLRHGTGAINVDGCRIGTDDDRRRNAHGGNNGLIGSSTFKIRERRAEDQPETEGRWPANVCHDGSEEVEAAFAAFGEGKSPASYIRNHDASGGILGKSKPVGFEMPGHGDSGTASRFFYSSKAGPEDRFGSKHPTVKPVSLMRWLVRLVTPPGGLVLDPFAGSGSTGIAAIAEGMRAILIERDPEHQADIREHLAWATGEGRHALASKARNKEGAKHDDLPLFANPVVAE